MPDAAPVTMATLPATERDSLREPGHQTTFPCCAQYASTVFSSSMAGVMAPVPPGIGVIQPGHLGHGVEVDVADDAGLGAGDAHVEHGGAGLHEVGRDEPADAHRRHEDVGLAAHAGQVGAAGVGDGDGGVGALGRQQQRHRQPDQRRAADHDRPPPAIGTS